MSETMDELLDALESYITQNRRLLQEDRVEEFSGLVPMAERIHEQAKTLEGPAKGAALERLATVMADLVVLEEELRARRGGVAEELQAMTRLRQANQAYQPKTGNNS